MRDLVDNHHLTSRQSFRQYHAQHYNFDRFNHISVEGKDIGQRYSRTGPPTRSIRNCRSHGTAIEWQEGHAKKIYTPRLAWWWVVFLYISRHIKINIRVYIYIYTERERRDRKIIYWHNIIARRRSWSGSVSGIRKSTSSRFWKFRTTFTYQYSSRSLMINTKNRIRNFPIRKNYTNFIIIIHKCCLLPTIW